MRDTRGRLTPSSISAAHAKKGHTLVYDGVQWKPAAPAPGGLVIVQTTAPASPATGQLWYDTDATC